MNPLSSNYNNFKRLYFLILAVMLIYFVSIISDIMQAELLGRVSLPQGVSNEEATSNDTRQRIIGIASMIIYILSAIFFIIWFYRAYTNLHIKSLALQYPAGWAIGAWFVPFLNLVRPYQIMKELFINTDEFIRANNKVSSSGEIKIGLLKSWWALWLIHNIISQIVFRLATNADSLNMLKFVTYAGIFLDIIGIAKCIITIKVISKYSVMEEEFYQISTSLSNIDIESFKATDTEIS